LASWTAGKETNIQKPRPNNPVWSYLSKTHTDFYEYKKEFSLEAY
jgi:hypothetical protein